MIGLRIPSRFLRCRLLSTSTAPPNAAHRASAMSVIQQKLDELKSALVKADSYLGPLNSAEQLNDVNFGDARHLEPSMNRLRVVPAAKSFYMANPMLEETLRSLRAFARCLQTLPRIPTELYRAPAWIDPNSIYSTTNRGISSEAREEYYKLLNSLNRIEPQLQPPALRELFSEMINSSGGSSETAKDVRPKIVTSLLFNHKLDANGRSVTVARRKTASARALIARALDFETQPGNVLINGVSIEQAFPSVIQRSDVLHPLRVANLLTKLNISVSVIGGGYSSQAQAAGLAIAKGICVQNPLLTNRLLQAGCLLSDGRKRERKKPGLARARKSYGWVKR